MRHEKIDLADLAALPTTLCAVPSDAEEKGAKGPPIALKHFYFCGRSTTRARAISVRKF